MSTTSGPMRDYCDADAATYDQADSHTWAPLEPTAWHGALQQFSAAAPVTVLDVGASTGWPHLLSVDSVYTLEPRRRRIDLDQPLPAAAMLIVIVAQVMGRLVTSP